MASATPATEEEDCGLVRHGARCRPGSAASPVRYTIEKPAATPRTAKYARQFAKKAFVS
jgi:hypothetical protein